MRRHIPGLHLQQRDGDSNLDGAFLVRVEASHVSVASRKAFPGTSIRRLGTTIS